MTRDMSDVAPGSPDNRTDGHAQSKQRGQPEDGSGKYEALGGRPSCKVVMIAAVLAAVTVLAVVLFFPGDASKTLRLVVPPPLPDNDTKSKGGQQKGGPPVPLPGRCDSASVPKESKCTGCPPMYEGKLCASTTRYNDRTKGACGCGRSDPVPNDWWTLTNYTAALNCINLDPERPLLSWCPAGCGGCYRLCSTGGTTSGKPGVTKSGTCRTFTVTNRCGDGYKQYPEWCSNELTWQQCQDNPALCSNKGSTNKFGYPAHFDLQDFHLQVSKELGWDNAEVTFEEVACGGWRSSAAACPGCTHGNMSFI
mmetsp:Transcript_57091/g.113501  ORF Transcript_57091/g.113501 Transcript_57091/m.113501 type:complete len:309 (+) Transcript_57091:32-958(+)